MFTHPFAAQAIFRRQRDSNRVARVRAEYPDQLDYSGHAHQISQQTKAGNNSLRPCTSFPPFSTTTANGPIRALFAPFHQASPCLF